MYLKDFLPVFLFLSWKVVAEISHSDSPSMLINFAEGKEASWDSAYFSPPITNHSNKLGQTDEVRFVDIFRDLGLPEDFADALQNDWPPPRNTTKHLLPESEPPKNFTVLKDGNCSTGNRYLDVILNCPCGMDDLEAVGLRGTEWDHHSSYSDIPVGYGPPGDIVSNTLNNGNVFGQVIRLTLGLPHMAIGFLRPMAIGTNDKFVQTTDVAAGLVQEAAKVVPQAARSAATILNVILNNFGDVAGGLLHILSQLIATFGNVKTSLSGTIPTAFNLAEAATDAAGTALGSAANWVGGTKGVLTPGLAFAGKGWGHLFSGLFEGGKGLSAGLWEGLALGGWGDEPPPPPDDDYGWGWKR